MCLFMNTSIDTFSFFNLRFCKKTLQYCVKTKEEISNKNQQSKSFYWSIIKISFLLKVKNFTMYDDLALLHWMTFTKDTRRRS